MDAATFIWMFFVLKVPVVAACLLVWWAVREPEPVDEDADDRDDGGSKQPRHPRPPKPGPPRRGGPHASPAPGPPARVRVARRASARHVR